MELRQISSLVCCTIPYSDYNPPGHFIHFSSRDNLYRSCNYKAPT